MEKSAIRRRLRGTSIVVSQSECVMGKKGGSRYPKRNSQKVFDESIWESQSKSKRNTSSRSTDSNSKQTKQTNHKNSDENHCSKCNLVFRGDNREHKLRQHQVTCLKVKLDPQDSFLKHVPARESYDKTEK